MSSTFEQWRQAQNFARVIKGIDDKPLLWVHRPIVVHDRNNTGKPCPCCGSMYALEVSRRDHIDTLFLPSQGVRKVRHLTQDKAAWDKLTNFARKVELPLRGYDKQLRAILAKPKEKGTFGGVRGGKSDALTEELIDEWLIKGGRGCALWWVSPGLKQVEIAFDKLFRGEGELGRRKDPKIPAELVLSSPRDFQQRILEAKLCDGTTIRFWHGQKESQFKGTLPIWVGVDEGAEIDKKAVFAQLRERLIQSGGRMSISTTPKAGAPVKDIYDNGVELDEWDGTFAKQVWSSLTSFDNPWINAAHIDDHIKTFGDDTQRIRREIYGEWVGDGPTLWRQYDTDVHTFDGPWRDCDDYNLVNITAKACGRFFRNSKSRHLKFVGGMDFNIWPMSLVICQIACPRGMDQQNTENWIVFVQDEIVKKGNVYQFGDFVSNKAGAFMERRLAMNHFGGMAIACDSTAAQRSYNDAHGVSDKSSNLVKELCAQGFDARPCNLSKNGKPNNPSILDRISLAHKIMRDRIKLPDGSTMPRFMVNSSRCRDLIKALESQESDERGKPIKEHGTVTDRLSGPTDALTYLMWAIFSTKEYGKRSKLTM